MSTDEYSEDVPDDDDLHGSSVASVDGSTAGIIPADPSSLLQTGSSIASSNCSSYQTSNVGGLNSSCSIKSMSGMMMSERQIGDNNISHQQFDSLQDSNLQRQKRKYTRRKSPEERKRRGPRTKDLNAPRMPLNGYVRFLNANRERIKQENPELTFAEVTKKLAAEWSSMDPEEKKSYLDEAERAKEIYLKELHEYQRSESYQEFIEMKQRAKQIEQQQQQQQQQIMSLSSQGPSPHHQVQYGQQQQQQYFNSRNEVHHPTHNLQSQSGHYHQQQQYPSHSSHQYSQQQTGQYGSPQPPRQYLNKYSSPNGQGTGANSTSSNSSSNASIPYSHQNAQYYSNNNNSHHILSGGGHRHYDLHHRDQVNSMSSWNRPGPSGLFGSTPMDHHNQNYHQNSNMPPNSMSPPECDYSQQRRYSSMSSSLGHSQHQQNNNNHPMNDPNGVPNNTAELENNPNPNSLSSILEKRPGNSIIDLPIFTEEFLEHNKMREQELKNLRSFTMDYEEANAISSKHIDDMIKASDLLAAEEEKERETHGKLKSTLDRLQQALVEHLSRNISGIPRELVQQNLSMISSSSQEDDTPNNNPNEHQQQNEYEYGPVTRENLDQFMNTLNKVRNNIPSLNGSGSNSSCGKLEQQQTSFLTSIRSAIASLDEIII